jgi:hypothetical protein
MRNQNFMKVFLLLSLTFGLAANFGLAQSNQSQAKSTQTDEEKQRAALIGKWTSSEAKVEFFKDGSITINGDKFTFGLAGKVIMVETDDGHLEFPFVLKGDTLTVLFEGRKIVYTRVTKDDDGEEAQSPASNKRGGQVPPELAGYWCYQANINANNGGGRYSRVCFKLYPNGTYEYFTDSSNSNPNGGSTAQSSDYGRWRATATTITAYSSSGQTTTYSLEKRNHPKTGDAMLIVDGDAFVTQTQRPSW